MEQIGPYRVLAELGRGGMGAVYRVQDPHVDRQVALKLIQLNATASPSALERFFREAEVLARVKHPGVVNVHGIERLPQGAYLTQDLVEGKDLESLARGDDPLAPEEAARIVREIADALAAVHREGILHRDLKPANVILTPEGAPILLDFGVARDLNAESLTQTGVPIGTPVYMSPEQAGGEPAEALGPHTDVYGLGTILYELLLGQPPFAGSQFAVLKNVLMKDPPWPSSERPEVPTELEAVLRMAMAKDPGQRYPDAESFREDLDCFLEGVPTRAGKLPPPCPPLTPFERALRAAGAIGAALCLLVGLTWGALTLAVPKESPTPTQVRSKPTPTPKRENPNRWWLKPGDRIVADIEIREAGGALVTWLLACATSEVIECEGEVATLRMELTEIRCDMRIRVDDKLPEAPTEAAGVSKILKKSAMPVTWRVDLRTGQLLTVAEGGAEVRVAGLDKVRAKLAEHSAEIDVINRQIQDLAKGSGGSAAVNPVTNLRHSLNRLFHDRYLGTALGALSHVPAKRSGRPASGLYPVALPLPWDRKLGQGREGRKSYFLRCDLERPLLEYSIYERDAEGQKNLNSEKVTLDGKATFADGRLLEAEVEQTGSVASKTSLYWSWVLQPD